MWLWLAGLYAHMSSELAPNDFSGVLFLCVPISVTSLGLCSVCAHSAALMLLMCLSSLLLCYVSAAVDRPDAFCGTMCQQLSLKLVVLPPQPCLVAPGGLPQHQQLSLHVGGWVGAAAVRVKDGKRRHSQPCLPPVCPAPAGVMCVWSVCDGVCVLGERFD